MTSVYDVPPDKLIAKLKSKFKTMNEFTPPDWAQFVKTGVHKEKPPDQKDWWYTRVAAVMRKVYILGPIGVSRLSAKFGGKQDRGSAPYHARKGSGAIIREALQQLERAGFVAKTEKGGRVVTSKGRSFIDNTAHEVLRELVMSKPELGKY